MTYGLSLSTIGLIMSADTRDNSISVALFGRVRCAILALLLNHSGESFYLRQIQRILGSSHGAVYRELGNLVDIGLVTRTSKGKQVHYQANADSPVFAEIRELIAKTTAVPDTMGDRTMLVTDDQLSEIVRRIVDAVSPLKIILFGSTARGEAQPDSDVDVLVVVPDGVHRLEAAQVIYRHLLGVKIAVDIVVATETDIEVHKDSAGLVYREALRNGRMLYAA